MEIKHWWNDYKKLTDYSRKIASNEAVLGNLPAHVRLSSAKRKSQPIVLVATIISVTHNVQLANAHAGKWDDQVEKIVNNCGVVTTE